MKRTILILAILAGCDDPGEPEPTERERCVEYLACFDECLWTPPEQLPGYPPTPGPLPSGCRAACDFALDSPLTWSAADNMEAADWAIWWQTTAYACAMDDQECLDFRLAQLENLLVAYEESKRTRAYVCAFTEDE